MRVRLRTGSVGRAKHALGFHKIEKAFGCLRANLLSVAHGLVELSLRVDWPRTVRVRVGVGVGFRVRVRVMVRVAARVRPGLWLGWC